MTAKKAVAKKPAKEPAGAPGIYTARMKLLGKTYDATGTTAMQAIENLKVERNPKGRGILAVSNGTRTVEKILQPLLVVRLFSLSPLTRQTALKNLYLLFKI